MASHNTPAWLQENTTEAPVAMAVLETEVPVPAPPPPTNGSTPTSSAADEAELPSIILFMRLANMGVAIAMITVSVRIFFGSCCDLLSLLLLLSLSKLRFLLGTTHTISRRRFLK
jgi:hypothetical protein